MTHHFPPNVIRAVLVKARFVVQQDAGASMHGAMFAACDEMAQADNVKKSELYSQARLYLDQVEKLTLLDAAIAALPAAEEMGEGR